MYLPKITSDALNWLSLAATVFFGLIAVYFYFRSRRFKHLVCTYATTRLQTKAHPEVEILFRKQAISNLTRILVCCWNAGNEEIRKADVPRGAILRLASPESRVLSVTVLASSTDAIGARATRDSNDCVRVDFEYLNPQEGAVLEILAEMGSPAANTLSVSAPVIGARPSTVLHYDPRKESWVEGPLAGLVSVAGVTSMVAVAQREDRMGASGLVLMVTAIFGCIVVVTSLFGVYAFSIRRRRARCLPKFAWRCFVE
jgi:hypothetical protein